MTDGNRAILNQLGLYNGERRIVALLMEGLSNQEIGTSVGISEARVKTHVTRILQASSVRSRTRLMVKLWSLGWGFKPAVIASSQLPRGVT